MNKKISQISSRLSFKLFKLEIFSVAKKKELKMNRLICGIFLGLIAIVTAQYQPPFQNRPQYQPQYQQPQQPYGENYDDPCRRPGADCFLRGENIDTRERYDINGNRLRYTRICDERGCYDRRNGSSTLTTNFALMTICAVLAAAKIFSHWKCRKHVTKRVFIIYTETLHYAQTMTLS